MGVRESVRFRRLDAVPLQEEHPAAMPPTDKGVTPRTANGTTLTPENINGLVRPKKSPSKPPLLYQMSITQATNISGSAKFYID
jgi:hypothetical protein